MTAKMKTHNVKELKDLKNINLKYKKDELEKVIPFLKRSWRMQNNIWDKNTDRIYKAKSFDEVLDMHKKEPFKSLDYAARRYFNLTTSSTAEDIFCSYNICRPEPNFRHKSIDFYILDEPFDLKVSSFPGRFPYEREQFATERHYRNELIKSLYRGQSNGRRYHLDNRLFIVCKDGDGRVALNNNILKKDLPSMKEKINAFLSYTLDRSNKGLTPFNEVTLDNGEKVYSDIIFLTN